MDLRSTLQLWSKSKELEEQALQRLHQLQTGTTSGSQSTNSNNNNSTLNSLPWTLSSPPSYDNGINSKALSSSFAFSWLSSIQPVNHSLSHLDTVALEAQQLNTSLIHLHKQAESSVSQVRQLDTFRSMIQSIVERIDDLLELKSILAGLNEATQQNNIESIALHIRRFHSIEKILEVPENDVQLVRNIEQTLIQQLTEKLDHTLEQHKNQQQYTSSSSAAHVTDEVLSHTITHYCQLMTLLGKNNLGITRYTNYISSSLYLECSNDLRYAASVGVDSKLAALNIVSSMFGRAASALDNSVVIETQSMIQQNPSTDNDADNSTNNEETNLLLAIHRVINRCATRVLLSFARSTRMQTALYAREILLAMSENKQMVQQQLLTENTEREDQYAGEDSESPQEGISAALSSIFLTALEDETNDAPFIRDPPELTGSNNWITSSVFNSVDLAKPVAYDAFLDEIILLIQRCTSYWRLMIGKALIMYPHPSNSLVDSSSTETKSSSGSFSSALLPIETAAKEHHQLFDAVKEIGNKYSALENSYIQSGVNKAIILEEIIEEGIQGASIDLSDITIPVTASTATNTFGTDILQDLNKNNTSSTGKGAFLSTFVEDTFYVLQKAAKRAFASGNADVTAAVLNSIVATIQERICNELDTRFRLALATDPNDVAKVSNTMTPIQIDRYNSMRNNVMVSSPVRNSLPYITEYATVGCSNNQGIIKTDNSIAQLEMFGSPNKGMGSNSLFRSPSDLGNGSVVSSSSSLATGTPPSASAASFGGRQGLKLTEEIAIVCLVFNNYQLAAECTVRLQKLLEEETVQVFQDTKEVTKVRTSLNGLHDCVHQLRKQLENNISTVVTRLTPRLRSALNIFEGSSSLIQYELTENTFSINSSVLSSSSSAVTSNTLNAFTTEFLPTLGTILAPYQYGLTPSLAYSLINKVIIYINKQLEPRLRRKRYNQYGSLQCDNDIRILINFFHLRIPYQYIRNKFLRLVQFCQIINLETPKEIYEYWGNNNNSLIPWEYTGEEIKTILSLRTDFTIPEIQTLQL